MDSQELEELVRQPQESAKLDFKLLSYKLFEPQPTKPTDPSKQKTWKEQRDKWEDDRIRQWGELVKDVISLANGNIGTVHQTAYLIIGADDKLRPDGTPNVLDVGDQAPTRKETYEKVNSYCQPRLPDLHCDAYQFEGNRLLVISIPPSPYLHKLSKQLKTPKKDFSPYTVLIRRGDGEEIYEASREEQEAIEKEKKAFSQTLPKVAKYENIRLGGVEESDFFGREQEIEKLKQLFEKRDRLIIVSISGMGGVGKTELAIQYARQHFQHLGHNSGGVCWIDAREENVGIQLVRFAETFLDLKFQEGWDLKTQLNFCWQNWGVGDWLFVIDDVTDYREQVKPYLPSSSLKFKVLLTIREEIGRPVENIPIQELRPDAAQDVLQTYIGSNRIEKELEVAKELCTWLGYLPLGLELVGRYLERDPELLLQEMLSRLEKKSLKQKALLNVDNHTMTAERGVAAAFELSWEKLNSTAQELGCLLSVFALAEISWSAVVIAYASLNSIENLDIKQEELDESKVELLRLNLLQKTREGLFKLHQLIREFFKDKRELSDKTDDFKRSFSRGMLVLAVHISETLTRDEVMLVSSSVSHILELVKDSDDDLKIFLRDQEVLTPFVALCNFYKSQGLYEQAIFWLRQCHLFVTNRFVENHPNTIKSMNNLGAMYYTQGKYSEAEPLLEKALEHSSSLGEDDDIIGNLALLYWSQGRYSKAETLLKKSLTLKEQAQEKNQLKIATALNNLSCFYEERGQYLEAELLCIRALEIRKDELGENYPESITSLNNLANIYESQAQYEEAEPLYKKCLDLRTTLLGEEHPDTAQSYNNLAYLYKSQGRYREAEPIFMKAIELRDKLLEENHPDIAQSINNLADLYMRQERFKEAEPLLERVLKIRQVCFGRSHPKTVYSRQCLLVVRNILGLKPKGNKDKNNFNGNFKGFGKPKL